MTGFMIFLAWLLFIGGCSGYAWTDGGLAAGLWTLGILGLVSFFVFVIFQSGKEDTA